MARKLLGLLVLVTFGLGISPIRTLGGDDALKKELAALNLITGNDPMRGALKGLVDNPKHAKQLLTFALPAAKKKELSYNAALILALAASDLKDLKTAETYMRVCMEKAAKLQSVEKLRQSYGLMVGLYFDEKMYADAARIGKELLELNTDDGKDRKVLDSDYNKLGDRFDTAQQLRPEILEIYIKAVAKQGRFDQAIKLIDNLLKKNDDWIDRHLKGWVLKEAGKLADAATVYEDVIKQAEADERFSLRKRDAFIEQFRYDLSNVYIELKKIDRATEHLEILIKKRPDKAGYYNDLGYIWADNDIKLDEAEKMIRKAIDLDRERRKKSPKFDPKTDHDPGAYLDSLGWVLFKRKNYKEAKEWLIKASEDKSAQHIEIFDHLGEVHMILGERDLAVKAWTKGLEFVTDTRRDQAIKAAVEKKIEKAKSK